MADAYAGLNWFSGDAPVQEAVRAETERNAPARRAEAQQETTGPPEGRGTIVVLPDGKKYVQADRQVIFGNDPDSWAGQIEGYINRKIRNGEDVILTTDSGDVLKITEDTAGKASFRNYVRDENSTMRRMTDAEYEVKLNAEAHIDELAQISERINKKPRKDETARNGQPIHGELARNGWIYREARFKDFDGTYYQVTISTADGGNGVVVYNVGKMEKKTSPAIKHGSSDSITETGAQQGKSSSTVTIRQTEGDSQEKSSGKASVEVNPDDTATQRLKERQFELIQNNHPKDDWDYQTWINKVVDVKTYQEAVDDDRAGTPDFDDADIDQALKTGRVRVYSSHRIRIGTFVTPSRIEAESYAGSKNVYSKTVPLTDVAWIDSIQGQFAPTSGEIEARDTASRRRMSAEERKNTPPKLGDADTVFADRGTVNYMRAEKAAYDEESASIKEQIIRNQETLNKMAVVSKKTVPTNLRSKPKAAEWAINELNTRPDYVDRRGLGKVDVSQKAIREAVKYADTPAEKAALVAAPDVIKRGIEDGGHNDHKSRRKATLTIAAPVELNGQRGNMAVVINLRGNKYYAHRILTPDGSVFEFEQSMEMKKDTERESQRGVTVSGSLANATSSVFINTIRSSERESQEKTSGRASTRMESRAEAERKEAEAYRDAYASIYDFERMSVDEIEKMLTEEIAADAYAGLNWFSGDAPVQEAVRAETERNAPARKAEAQQETTGPPEGRAQAFVGYDAETGRGIYRSNFEDNTPKAKKSERVIRLIQDVWSKNPIDLVVENEDGSKSVIKAEFDPRFDEGENTRSDAAKLAAGNRHGTAGEKRVTLNLADDFYRIIQESTYSGSKAETGKTSDTHAGVNMWQYFVNPILYMERSGDETTPYTVSIDVKQKDNGNFVYSFHAERDAKNNGQPAPQTLHAAVNGAENDTANGLPTDSIRSTYGNSQEKSSGKASVEVNPDDTATRRLKERQFELIQNNHPKEDWDYQTWINSVDDVKTYQEAVDDDRAGTPDFDDADIDRALKTGRVRVYSSHRIRIGTFVTPSRMEAESYAGSENVYSKTVPLTDVAWIDSLQGQFAPTSGEIEARDTAFRRRMSAEERKNTPPDLGDADTVFADEGGTSMAVDEDSNNEKASSDNKKREPKYTVIDGGDTAGKESALAEAYDKAVKQGKGVEISKADLKKYQDIRDDPEQTLIEAVKKYYEESLKGTSVEVTANDGVVEIRFENDGKEKSVGWRMKADKAATFEKLHQLTENAEYAYSEVNRNENERTSIPMFHYFVNNAKIAGRDISVKIQVRDVITRANSKETRYYTHTLEKNMRGNSGPVAGTQGANIDSNAIAPSKTNIRSTAGNSQEKSSGRASTRVENRAEAERSEAEAYEAAKEETKRKRMYEPIQAVGEYTEKLVRMESALEATDTAVMEEGKTGTRRESLRRTDTFTPTAVSEKQDL